MCNHVQSCTWPRPYCDSEARAVARHAMAGLWRPLRRIRAAADAFEACSLPGASRRFIYFDCKTKTLWGWSKEGGTGGVFEFYMLHSAVCHARGVDRRRRGGREGARVCADTQASPTRAECTSGFRKRFSHAFRAIEAQSLDGRKCWSRVVVFRRQRASHSAPVGDLISRWRR